MAKFSGIKAGGKTYDIWATKAEVEALNNQGNAGLASEVASGKTLLANAINTKGGTATSGETLSQLSTDILNIPINIQVEDAAKLAFPESMSWNILSEAYAKQRVGYKSWIVAEFFKGYDTIPLSGADAYLTCDGAFYTEATTHTWNDDAYNKVNRYVIYYFVWENIPFSVTQESVCPRSMAVMGKFSSININTTGRIRQIYNGGEIGDICFSGTNPAWGQEVLLANVREHNSGYIVNGNANVAMLGMDIETLNGGAVVTRTGNSSLDRILMSNLKTINNGYVLDPLTSTGTNELLKEINCPELIEIKNGAVWRCHNYDSERLLTSVLAPKLKKISGNGAFISTVRGSSGYLPTNFVKIYLPSLEEIEVVSGNYCGIIKGEYNYSSNTLREIICPSLVKGGSKIIVYVVDYGGLILTNLIKVEIGQNYNDNLNLHNWGATNALLTDSTSLVDEGETFANNREKFLYNFERYIVDKLADNSTTGLRYTLTLSGNVFAVVNATQSITDKLTAKRWTLASPY